MSPSPLLLLPCDLLHILFSFLDLASLSRLVIQCSKETFSQVSPLILRLASLHYIGHPLFLRHFNNVLSLVFPLGILHLRHIKLGNRLLELEIGRHPEIDLLHLSSSCPSLTRLHLGCHASVASSSWLFLPRSLTYLAVRSVSICPPSIISHPHLLPVSSSQRPPLISPFYEMPPRLQEIIFIEYSHPLKREVTELELKSIVARDFALHVLNGSLDHLYHIELPNYLVLEVGYEGIRPLGFQEELQHRADRSKALARLGFLSFLSLVLKVDNKDILFDEAARKMLNRRKRELDGDTEDFGPKVSFLSSLAPNLVHLQVQAIEVKEENDIGEAISASASNELQSHASQLQGSFAPTRRLMRESTASNHHENPGGLVGFDASIVLPLSLTSIHVEHRLASPAPSTLHALPLFRSTSSISTDISLKMTYPSPSLSHTRTFELRSLSCPLFPCLLDSNDWQQPNNQHSKTVGEQGEYSTRREGTSTTIASLFPKLEALRLTDMVTRSNASGSWYSLPEQAEQGVSREQQFARLHQNIVLSLPSSTRVFMTPSISSSSKNRASSWIESHSHLLEALPFFSTSSFSSSSSSASSSLYPLHIRYAPWILSETVGELAITILSPTEYGTSHHPIGIPSPSLTMHQPSISPQPDTYTVKQIEFMNRVKLELVLCSTFLNLRIPSHLPLSLLPHYPTKSSDWANISFLTRGKMLLENHGEPEEEEEADDQDFPIFGLSFDPLMPSQAHNFNDVGSRVTHPISNSSTFLRLFSFLISCGLICKFSEIFACQPTHKSIAIQRRTPSYLSMMQKLEEMCAHQAEGGDEHSSLLHLLWSHQLLNSFTSPTQLMVHESIICSQVLNPVGSSSPPRQAQESLHAIYHLPQHLPLPSSPALHFRILAIIFDSPYIEHHVELYVAYGADMNMKNELGRTWIHLAIEKRHTRLVKALLYASTPLIKLSSSIPSSAGGRGGGGGGGGGRGGRGVLGRRFAVDITIKDMFGSSPAMEGLSCGFTDISLLMQQRMSTEHFPSPSPSLASSTSSPSSSWNPIREEEIVSPISVGSATSRRKMKDASKWDAAK